jgi:hypothetical protein
MYNKYHIVASANCKDQIGTDGYTLWGGYWNQAYYPSRYNGYMPAQTAEGQIGVPVFRMLGSDPIYQYESGLGSNGQSVITLEPVYGHAGASSPWVHWFLKSFAGEPCLAFAYTQAGQENSFTWKSMQHGLEMQAFIFDSLRNAGKITVETMQQSGRWFKQHFPLTPATAVTATQDYLNMGHKAVWYNSRFYRASIMCSHDSLNIRDIHLFDERMRSDYIDTPGTSTQCIYETLPFVDGNQWSKGATVAGLRLVQLLPGGKMQEITGGNFEVKEEKSNQLLAAWRSLAGESFTIHFYEDRIEVSGPNTTSGNQWALALTAAPGRQLPFTVIQQTVAKARFRGFDYHITCLQGRFKAGTANSNIVLTIIPVKGKVAISGKTLQQHN